MNLPLSSLLSPLSSLLSPLSSLLSPLSSLLSPLSSLLSPLMILFLFSGCGNGAGNKTIEFWTVFTGADGKSMQKIVDAYNAQNPEYRVNHRAIAEGDLYLKLPLAIQSGRDVPDVSIMHVERIRSYTDKGFLTDYTPYLAQSSIARENYAPKAWDLTDIEGGHWGIPLDIHAYVLYANMDLYNTYGKHVLDDGILTWDELKSIAPDCLAAGIIPIGLSWLRVSFLSSYAQLGGTLSDDGFSPSFDNEAARTVLNLWDELYKSGYTQKDGDSPWELFLGGRMLFCPEGQWMYNNVKESGLNAKMFDYPVFSEQAKGNWASSHQFVLPVNKNRDEAKTLAVLDFINFLGNNGLEWALAGQTPAHISIKNEAGFTDLPQAFLADENEELKLNDYRYYGQAVESLDKVLGEVLFGRMSADQALSQAVQETSDRIAQERQ